MGPPTKLLSDIAVLGGTHYVFEHSAEQLRVTNPRAKKGKAVKKEKGGSGSGPKRGKKRTVDDGGDAEGKPGQKRQKNRYMKSNITLHLSHRTTGKCLIVAPNFVPCDVGRWDMGQPSQ